MTGLFSSLIDYMEEEEWKYEILEGETIIRFHFKGRAGRLLCYGEVDEEKCWLIFYSYLPVNAPPEKHDRSRRVRRPRQPRDANRQLRVGLRRRGDPLQDLHRCRGRRLVGQDDRQPAAGQPDDHRPLLLWSHGVNLRRHDPAAEIIKKIETPPGGMDAVDADEGGDDEDDDEEMPFAPDEDEDEEDGGKRF